MSIKVMHEVWMHSKQSGGALLTLLAMADCADDAGICWPSIATLARKARLHQRQVFYILQNLKAGGEIEILESGGGRRNNRYRVMTPANSAAVQLDALPPAPHRRGTVQPTASDPSYNHHDNNNTTTAPRRARRKVVVAKVIQFQEKEFEEGTEWLRTFLQNQDTFVGSEVRQRLLNYGWWHALDQEILGIVEPEFLAIEFAAMKRWIIQNPTKAPTESRAMYFISGWLRRAAERMRKKDEVFQGRLQRRERP